MEIINTTKSADGLLWYLVRWEGTEGEYALPSTEVNLRWPQTVIQYLESHMVWAPQKGAFETPAEAATEEVANRDHHDLGHIGQERIIGATDSNGDLRFMIKWKGARGPHEEHLSKRNQKKVERFARSLREKPGRPLSDFRGKEKFNEMRSRKLCIKCTEPAHKGSAQCRHKGTTCHKCKKIGHIARACTSEGQAEEREAKATMSDYDEDENRGGQDRHPGEVVVV
jgi:hypothetical protein